MMEQHQVARKSKAAKDKSAKKRAANGSELGSARGSEDRGPAVTQSGRSRGGRRDYDLEAVSFSFLSLF